MQVGAGTRSNRRWEPCCGASAPTRSRCRSATARPASRASLDGWEREAASGGVEGALQFDGVNVIAVEPVGGSGLMRDEARTLLEAELRDPERESVALPVGEIKPKVIEGRGRTRGRGRSRHAHRQPRHRRERCDRSDHTRTARDRARNQDRRPPARARHRQRQAARRARCVVGHGRAGAGRRVVPGHEREHGHRGAFA